MLQSSISAWLKKPASVLKPKQETPPPAEPQNTTSSSTPSARTITSPPPASAPSVPVPGPAQQSPPAQTQPQPSPNAAPPSTSFGSSPLRPLPPNVEFVPLTPDLVPAFKRLNAISFPISYHPHFYTETLEDPVIHSITLMALWHSVPPQKGPGEQSKESKPSEEDDTDEDQPTLIGAIRCRILPTSMSTSTLYLSTISLLSPYRAYGIATHLLHAMIVKAVREYGVRDVTAHVWEKNEEALEWYAKRGFKVVGKEEGYYRKLKPGGALLVRKTLGVGDLL